MGLVLTAQRPSTFPTAASAGMGADGHRPVELLGKGHPGPSWEAGAPLLMLLGSLEHPCLLPQPLDDLGWMLLHSEPGSSSGPRGLW